MASGPSLEVMEAILMARLLEVPCRIQALVGAVLVWEPVQ